MQRRDGMAESNASPMLGDVGGDVKRGSIEAAVFRVAIPVDSGEQASPHCYMEGHAVHPKQRKNSMMNIERTELGLWLLVPETKQKEVKKSGRATTKIESHESPQSLFCSGSSCL